MGIEELSDQETIITGAFIEWKADMSGIPITARLDPQEVIEDGFYTQRMTLLNCYSFLRVHAKYIFPDQKSKQLNLYRRQILSLLRATYTICAIVPVHRTSMRFRLLLGNGASMGTYPLDPATEAQTVRILSGQRPIFEPGTPNINQIFNIARFTALQFCTYYNDHEDLQFLEPYYDLVDLMKKHLALYRDYPSISEAHPTVLGYVL